jgi:hypothetical protein
MRGFRARAQLRMGALCAAVGLAGIGTGVTGQAAPAAQTTVTCGPKQVTHVPAPGRETTTTYVVGVAGEVSVRQTSVGTLRVDAVTAALGWEWVVSVDIGPSVRVIFYGPAKAQVRFVGRLSLTYDTVTTTIVSCT